MSILHGMLLISNLLLLFSQFTFATDTITNLDSLPDDGTTLVSNDGTFELGFFNPGSSSNRYVGIWYKNIQVRTVVWVANRDNPIKDNSSKLIISQDGNLVLLNKNNSILWSTNTTAKAASPVAQPLDTGNLIVRDEKDNNSNNEESFLWQSFDHPCDTLLPGMKIGWDRKSGINRLFTAWKNWDDPSSGNLTAATVLTRNPEWVIWKDSVEFFRSGPWSSAVLEFTNNPIYDFQFVNNEDEVYYTFTLKNSSVISINVLNQTLSLRQRLIWIPESKTWSIYRILPQDSCDIYNVCGPNGNCMLDKSPRCQCLNGFEPRSPQQWNALYWTEGCGRSEKWSCGVKNRDGFSRFGSMKLPDTTNSWIDENMTLEDCKAKCLQNCSCSAYANLNPSGGGSGCSIWFGDLLDLRVSQSGQDLYVRTDVSNTDSIYRHRTSRRRKKIGLAITIPGLAILVMVLAIYYICKTKTEKKEKDEGRDEDLELPFFDFATILNATNNFSIDNKLGEGGFGPVFKGLIGGQEIAVKRLSRTSGQGVKEFKNEVILCSKLQHRNLVKVVGCCIEGEEKMLLYEYMPNKSLDSFLFDSVQSKLLDWSTRFNILHGIARGILYLHQDSRLRIIHRDLKVSNILLDNDMNPKVSDFGMARMCGGDQIEGRTNIIVGTYGYMAPEYATDGLFSIKSDVFSFGVLLLEIISGKKNSALTYQSQDHNLIGHAWRLWKKGIPHELIDDCLKDSCKLEEVVSCIQIGLLCLQHHPDDRPNMASVVLMLSSENALPQPKEPGFLFKKVSNEGEHSPEKQTFSSMNEISLSLLNPR
ncbi:G-type lectin S-receptor-like serine/threonine-protein kinase At4g27290 isoform X2 [Lotus japonicus]|uniref:G-type lectin S-receptor-like serine/threonine-protein kinase At4g27290 isoform X2 n=1 Tax=Lotus japonicus TaxID=34305 RepID=UPI0025846C2D|nr:G-type lectin S-receptor-like serine/threonine-protein kinase At4g27290 isoform X2 [Lotus japonicus]